MQTTFAGSEGLRRLTIAQRSLVPLLGTSTWSCGCRLRFRPWLCENVKSREGQRTCFSDTAAPQFSMLLTLPKQASKGILFFAICSALRFYTAQTQLGHSTSSSSVVGWSFFTHRTVGTVSDRAEHDRGGVTCDGADACAIPRSIGTPRPDAGE